MAKTKRQEEKTEKEKEKDSEIRVSEKECFPTPQRKKPTSPTRNVITEGKQSLQEGTRILLPRESWRRNQPP